jgi:hypothetical protein
MSSATNEELDALMNTSPVPTAASLTGFDFRGWNVQKATEVLGFRKFIKGFFRDPAKGADFGYNMPVVQNRFDEPWQPRLKDGKETRYLFFGVLPGSQVDDAIHPTTLVVDYRKWKDNFVLSPFTYTVDYLVNPDPANPDLVLGKSYLQALGLKPFLGFFIIERLRPSTHQP